MDYPPKAIIAGRFELAQKVGEGGMGTVYRALDQRTGAEVALKILHTDALSQLDRFSREAATLGDISHPGIVRYVDHGTTEAGEPYLAMEWLAGETLEDRLKRGPIPLPDAVTLAKRVLEALAAVHRGGLVHRDIKPANLFLPGGDVAQVKILDFGLVRRVFENQRLTYSQMVIGTPIYMSPEQARGDADVDARSDIYSLGCVLVECLTGEVAHPSGPAAMACAEKPAGPLALLDRMAGLPPKLEPILRRMLARDLILRAADAALLARQFALVSVSDEPATSFTTVEQRVQSVVLLRAPEGQAARDPAELARVLEARDNVHIEPGAGGALVISWTNLRAPREQALQAARTALKLGALFPDASIAITTGRGVVIGAGGADGRAARGAKLLVDSLEARRKVAGIVIDGNTARLLDARFRIETEGETTTLVAEQAFDEAPRTVLGKHTSLVGRDRELATLEGLFREGAFEGVARAALIVAPAGGGKSRLRHGLIDRLRRQGEPFELLVGSGEAMRAATPFGLLGSALRAAAGIRGDEPPEEARRLLSDRLSSRLAEDAAPRATEFLGEIAGVPFPESPTLRAARQDPRIMADQLRVAVLDWLEAECAVQPVLFVVDDLHWGDRPSIELLGAALRTLRGKPFVLLGFARPELDARYPGLWDDRDAQRLRLPPLTKKSSVALVRQVLGDIDAKTEAWVLERSEGNPFYLEELMRAVAGGAGQDLPDTVLGMVQARFDTLGDEAKVVLRAASVFGTGFPRDGVAALLSEGLVRDLESWLDLLVSREVIFSPDPERGKELVFRHALLHEAAYDMVPEPARVVAHLAAGNWLERAGHGEPFVLAQHFERGADLVRAAFWCEKAAAQSLEANDLRGAIERAERAVGLGAAGEVRGLSRLVQAQARFFMGEYVDAETSAREAGSLLGGGDGWFSAVAEEIAALGQQAKFDEVERLVLEALGRNASEASRNARLGCLIRGASYLIPGGRVELGRRVLRAVEEATANGTVEPALAARLHNIENFLATLDGSIGVRVGSLEAALAAAEAAGDVRSVCEMTSNLGTAFADLGQFERAYELLQRALTTAERIDLEFVASVILINQGPVLAARGRFDQALAVMHKAITSVRKQGDQRCEGVAELYLSTIAYMKRDLDESLRAATRARALLVSVPPFLPCACAALARALLAQDRAQEALALAREANDLVHAMGHVEDYESLIRLVLAESLAACQNIEAAQAALEVARQRLVERAMAIPQDEWRASFLRLPDNLRTLGLARALGLTEAAPLAVAV